MRHAVVEPPAPVRGRVGIAEDRLHPDLAVTDLDRAGRHVVCPQVEGAAARQTSKRAWCQWQVRMPSSMLPRSSGKPMCGQRLSRANTRPLSWTTRIGRWRPRTTSRPLAFSSSRLPARSGNARTMCPWAAYLVDSAAHLREPLDGSTQHRRQPARRQHLLGAARRHGAGAARRRATSCSPARQQVAAGYAHLRPDDACSSSPSATGSPASRSTARPRRVHADPPELRVPDDTQEFAINTSNARFWEPPVQRYVDECLAGRAGPRGKPTSTCAGSPAWWPRCTAS